MTAQPACVCASEKVYFKKASPYENSKYNLFRRWTDKKFQRTSLTCFYHNCIVVDVVVCGGILCGDGVFLHDFYLERIGNDSLPIRDANNRFSEGSNASQGEGLSRGTFTPTREPVGS